MGFFKNELELQANIPILDDFVLQGTFNCGLLNRYDPDKKSMTLADKFYMGGPLNVRGFEMRGVGPESDGNAIGGEMYWATGLHMYAPLPFR